MNRKVLVAAVAAAFAAPAALAQTTVTIGGTINIMWDTVKSSGASANSAAGNFNMHSHDRVRDGSGSNIRFFVGEELGGGNQAFIQVESAVINNSDTRNNSFGAGAGTFGWGNRNSAIGIRSKPAGRFLIGVWDVHYDEMYGIESGWLMANSGSSALAVWQNFGSAFSVNPSIGTRFSNVIRWDSPQWGGFSLSAAYARPTDAAPANAQFSGVGGGSSVINDKKNRVWHVAARYQTGGLQVRYSYLRDDDAATTGAITFGGVAGLAGFGAAAGTISAVAGTVSDTAGNNLNTTAWEITSNRLGIRYRFAFGLGLGFVWDQSKLEGQHDGPINSTGFKRTSWAIPVTYEFGNHSLYSTYGKARDWKGNVGGLGVGDFAITMPDGVSTHTLGNETGSRFFTIGYVYKLSQRTNVHLSYQQIKNEALARYDFFANTSGTGQTNFGGDPRSFAAGIRHTF
jgi:predicted porin